MFSARTVLTAFALSLGVAAIPTPATSATIQPHQFDVYTPAITAPNATTVWQPGQTQIVSWSIEGLDAQGKNTSGYLLLGYLENDSENLDIKHPLANGFLLGDGQTTVTVPSVATRDDYIVVLLGDSGNSSPTFTIQNPSS